MRPLLGWLLLCTVFSWPRLLSAQSAAGTRDFAAEPFVLERVETRWTIKADGTGSHERTVTLKVQSEAALKDASVVFVPFASASEHVDIHYARARMPDGTLVETPVSDALEQPEPVTQAAPFYSDLKQKQLPIKSLRVGDTLEWQANVVRTRAEAPGESWGQQVFQSEAVVLSEVLELRFPKAMYVNAWTNPRFGVKPTVSTEGDEQVYRWERALLKPTVGSEAEAAKLLKEKKVLTPEEELDNREGKLPDVAWTTFKNWPDVGAWYASLERSRVEPDAAIRAKAAELTAGKASDDARARALYGYVAPDIRYIGVAFGVGRYQPHHASEVLENQYGDCKDKHTLLAALLTASGMHPKAVLIGAGIRFNEAVPSPDAFNHLITQVDIDGKPTWLDATQEVAPYRVLLYQMRDKPALVIPESGAAEVQRTPRDLPFPAIETMTAVGTLDAEGTSDSKITFVVRGDDELLLRQVLRQVPPSKYGELVQSMSEGMGYGGTASHPEFGRPENTTEPLTFSYDYKREKGGDWPNLRIIAQLKYASLPVLDEKKPPVSSIELGVPRTEISSSQMKLPAGWGAELPEAIHAKSDFATVDTTYRFADGTVYAERRVVVLKNRLPAADWKVYKKWADEAQLGLESYVQLTRPGTSNNAGLESRSGGGNLNNNAEAATLIQQAFQSMKKRDFDSAAVQLEKAQTLNPGQKNLRGAQAALKYDKGDYSGSIPLYQQEVDEYPDSYWVYEPMSNAQLRTGRRNAAEESLAKWMTANPTAIEPAVALASLMTEDGDASGAVKTLSTALSHLGPDDTRNGPGLQVALGTAQIKANQQDAGVATLAAVLANPDVDDPVVLNNAAYALADAGKKLTEAESAARKALQELSAESRSWTLDENLATLRAKSGFLVNTWDTLGWILHREGKDEAAAPWVQAAFTNSQSAAEGEHLGDIQAARGDKSDALHSYEFGLSLHGTGAADTLRIRSKVDELKKAGVKSGAGISANDLFLAWTLPVGAANGKKGEAKYIVLFSHEGVVQAKAVGDERIPGGVDAIEAMSNPHLVPAESDAYLVWSGILNCHGDSCSLLLQP